jgi:hypothetical protein
MSKNKQKNKRRKQESNADIQGTCTAYFEYLKRNWDPEQFRQQKKFFDKNYSGTVYTGNTGNTQRGNGWKKSRGADRDPEREERERLQLLQDYFPFDEE